MKFLNYFIVVLLIGVLLVPIVNAAPEIRDISLATVFVNPATDTFTFACGGGDTSMRPAAGSIHEIVSPNGQRASVQRTGSASCTAAMGGTTLTFQLDGTQILGDPRHWVWTGDLTGVPADGTWTITTTGVLYNSIDGTTGSEAPGPTLAIGGKGVHYGTLSSFPNTRSQFWNQHITGAGNTWIEPSTTTNPACTPCNADTLIEAADENPNNARFFQDAVNSPFTVTTLHFTVTCNAVPTMVVNGAWVGADLPTLSQFIYRDGLTGPSVTDMRLVSGFQLTTEENEGTTSGTDSKTIPYNNAAGTAYQFKVRGGTPSVEALGLVIYAPGELCTPAAPGGSILFIRNIGLDLSVSQAQCANDPISFTTDVDITALITLGDLQVTIFRASDGVEVATFDEAQMFTQNALQTYYFQTFLSPGSYMAIAQADLLGIGAIDIYDSAAVNVPVGDCIWKPTDLTDLLGLLININSTVIHNHEHLEGIDLNLTHIHGDIHNLNLTVAAIQGGNEELDVFVSSVIANENENILLTIIERNPDGTARLGNAANTDVYIFNPANTLVITAANPIEVQDGIYRYTYPLGTSPLPGNWYTVVSTTEVTTGNLIGTSNTWFVESTNALTTNNYFNNTSTEGGNLTVNGDTIFNGDITFTGGLLSLLVSLLPYNLLLLAVAFFAVVGEWKKDALYWFMCFILSLWLLFVRPNDSIIPIAVFVGWIFVTLYQLIALMSNGKAKNLGGEEE